MTTFNPNPTLFWQPDIPAALRMEMRTLLQAPSLTAALRALEADFSVRLLGLGESRAGVWFEPFEKQTVFARDVWLCLNGEPVIRARSICGLSAPWRSVLDCGTQPLGERLFDGSLTLTRSAFEYCGAAEGACGARRSWFEMQGARMGLAECFLPALAKYVPAVGGPSEK